MESAQAITDTAAPSKMRGRIGFAIRLILGLGLLAFLLSRVDRVALFHQLARERLAYFLAALMLYIAGQIVASVRWRYLAGMLALYGSVFEFIVYFFVGVFTNLFVPGLVGGDAARTVYLGRRKGHIGRAAASVAADRLTGLIALFWFAASCVALFGRGILPRAMIVPVLAVGVAALVGLIAMPFVLRAIEFMPARFSKISATLAPYMGQPIALTPAIGLSLILHSSQVVCQYLLAVGAGMKIPFWFFLVSVPTTNFFATMPITLSGLGVREGLYIYLFSLIGVPKTEAVALGLLWFTTVTISGLCGAAAFMVAKTTPEPLSEDTAVPDESPAEELS
ncbi:MAG TPA: lysylphosphatidylglycerol synthase transmembrane domain-containing protein [Candidatus Binataceae bacterium]|nr:lysylphosphatidylglycerol synthase transmembrane domain-containing protein [Candidatus Binataceae bacterium]